MRPLPALTSGPKPCSLPTWNLVKHRRRRRHTRNLLLLLLKCTGPQPDRIRCAAAKNQEELCTVDVPLVRAEKAYEEAKDIWDLFSKAGLYTEL